MTALSKATLKATWVANFKPRASDFANLIDSWTDYYASLERIGVASGSWDGESVYTSADVVGVPLLVGNTSATIMNIWNASFIVARYDSPSPFQQQFYGATANTTAVSYFSPGTLNMFSQGLSAATTPNTILMRCLDPSGNESTGANTISFFRARGNFSQYDLTRPNTALASGRTIGEITWGTTAVSGALGAIVPAAMRAITAANVTIGNAPVEIVFYVSSSGGANNETRAGRQFSVGQGFVHFQPVSGAPASPRAGMTYYDSSTNKLRCYNGTSWNDLF